MLMRVKFLCFPSQCWLKCMWPNIITPCLGGRVIWGVAVRKVREKSGTRSVKSTRTTDEKYSHPEIEKMPARTTAVRNIIWFASPRM